MLPYKVAKQYLKGPEQLVAKFDSLIDAKKFIAEKMEEDAAMRVNAAYLLYDTGELMETFKGGGESGSSTGSSTAGGQQTQGGKASGQSFSPSPLQTSLRPSGMPISSFKDTEGDKKK